MENFGIFVNGKNKIFHIIIKSKKYNKIYFKKNKKINY